LRFKYLPWKSPRISWIWTLIASGSSPRSKD
jgi:hypothetical protein